MLYQEFWIFEKLAAETRNDTILLMVLNVPFKITNYVHIKIVMNCEKPCAFQKKIIKYSDELV